jgi:tellurite resistance protein
MGLFNFGKTFAKFTGEGVERQKVLSAAAAACALVAYADKKAEPAEREVTLALLLRHKKIGNYFEEKEIRGAFNEAMSLVGDVQGQLELRRQVVAMKGTGDIAQDIYAFGWVVAGEEPNEEEKKVLQTLAELLDVPANL